MRCEDLARTIELWESGTLSKESALAAADHVGSCPDCSERFGRFLPLLLRDVEASARSDAGGAPVPDIAGPVMEKITAGGLRVGPARNGRRALAPIAAVLVAVLLLPVSYRVFRGGPAGNEVVVRFVVDLPEARSVSLVGDFSDWKPDVYRLKRQDDAGTWEIELRLPKGKVYTYNFVVDGAEWIPDPKAPCKVGDGFGGESSLLQL